MLKRRIIWIACCGLLFTSLSRASVTNNEAIIYECSGETGSFQQRFEVGKTQRVFINTNGLMQVEVMLDKGNGFESFLMERLLNSGINDRCARFLARHADAELLKLANGHLLARVHFAFDRAALSKEARDILQQAVTTLKAANQHYLVEGHTDSVGSEYYNLKLGKRRADSVVTLLVSQGVDISTLTVHSMGEGQPLLENRHAAGRQQNRRVDVTVAGDNN